MSRYAYTTTTTEQSTGNVYETVAFTIEHLTDLRHAALSNGDRFAFTTFGY